MKKFILLATMIIVALATIGCNDNETDPEFTTDPEFRITDLTGKWQNISDDNDVFTFYADKSGSYAYRYIDETNVATGAITYFPTSGTESYDFDYYTLEYNGSYYDLSFFGSPFPITNATFYMLEGYMRVKYDWSDYRGKAWYDVTELYKKIDD